MTTTLLTQEKTHFVEDSPFKDSFMRVTLLTPAHNEEDVIENCILSVKKLQRPANIHLEHIIIADRCKDKTVEICQRHGIDVLVKDFRGECVSAITDTLEYGVQNIQCDIIGKVDADVVLPEDWLQQLLPHLDEHTLSVASDVKSTGTFMWLRNLNYKLTPFGRQPRGAARLINRRLLERIGGFDRTRQTWDTALDLRAHKNGMLSKNISHVKSIEQRGQNIVQLISSQISTGRARKNLGISPLRTLLHAIFRGRFFVFLGYFIESLKKNT